MKLHPIIVLSLLIPPRSDASTPMIQQLFSFKGRSGRLEWWAVTLLGEGVAWLAILPAIELIRRDGAGGWVIITSLVVLVALAFRLTLAVTLRRLRERVRSPWMLALGLIPVVGLLWLLVECGFLPARREGGGSLAKPDGPGGAPSEGWPGTDAVTAD